MLLMLLFFISNVIAIVRADHQVKHMQTVSLLMHVFGCLVVKLMGGPLLSMETMKKQKYGLRGRK